MTDEYFDAHEIAEEEPTTLNNALLLKGELQKVVQKCYDSPQPEELKATIIGYKNNDGSSALKLYNWYLSLVRSIAFSYSSYTILGEDAENIAWVIFYESTLKYESTNYARFPGYIKKALITRMSNATRLKCYYNPHVENEEFILLNLPAERDDYWDKQVSRLDLRMAICSLKPHQQEIIHLIYFKELSFALAGELLNKSPHTICYHHYQALKALRKYFGVTL